MVKVTTERYRETTKKHEKRRRVVNSQSPKSSTWGKKKIVMNNRTTGIGQSIEIYGNYTIVEGSSGDTIPVDSKYKLTRIYRLSRDFELYWCRFENS